MLSSEIERLCGPRVGSDTQRASDVQEVEDGEVAANPREPPEGEGGPHRQEVQNADGGAAPRLPVNRVRTPHAEVPRQGNTSKPRRSASITNWKATQKREMTANVKCQRDFSR